MMKSSVRCLISTLVLIVPLLTSPQSTALTAAIPEPLRPWVDWVLYGQEERRCPLLYDESGDRRCAWPSDLRLAVTTEGARFQQSWHVDAESWLSLPGDRRHWPQAVTLDGTAALVIEREGRPALKAGPGDHRIAGQLIWNTLPDSFKVPAETALLTLMVEGVTIAHPFMTADGTVWLHERPKAGADTVEHLELQVLRKITDGVPLVLTTRLKLRVAGQGREVRLGPVLPEGFIPLRLNSPLPTRFEADGRLRVQVKPGDWTLEITARHAGPVEELSRSTATEPWPEQEIWSFAADNAVRVVSVAGVTAIDPQQTNLPVEWRSLPAYLMAPASTMKFITHQRGNTHPAPEQLSLNRMLWLDFDGAGYTVHDRLQGRVSAASRLEAAPELRLGRVTLNGQDQFITRRPGSEFEGVELRQAQVQLSADSRLKVAGVGNLPAVGWRLSPSALNITLNLPPGWRLIAASGAEHTGEAWIYRWTLFDVFIVLLIAAAFTRLWGWPWGLMALLGLILIYHEPHAPRLLWLNLLAAIALLRVLPAGRLQTLVRGYRLLSLLGLILVCLIFAVERVRAGLYPQLDFPEAAEPYQDLRAMIAPVPTAAPPIAPEAPLEGEERMAKSAPLREPEAAPEQRFRLAYNPDIQVQTGPGLPQWQWSRARLRWSGPVSADTRLRLWLLPPPFSRLLAFSAAGLVLALLGRVMNIAFSGRRALLLLTLCLLTPLPEARAEIPSPELLNELRARLLETADCTPRCAALSHLKVHASASEWQLTLDFHAQAESAVPLPLHAGRLQPRMISLDGANAILFRAPDGILWLRLPAGPHTVEISGSFPDSLSTLQLPLPLLPGRIDLELEGWGAEGVVDGAASGRQIQLTRLRREAETLEPGILPVFVSVERELVLGIDWQVETQVRRLSEADSAAVLAIPLLAGEQVTTPGIQAQDARVQLNLPPEQEVIEWVSSLQPAEHLQLVASETRDFIEVWRLRAAPIWHIEADGIPVIHHHDNSGDWMPEWHPWPGETLTLAISQPTGVAGKIVTIDQATLRLRPGERLSDHQLELTMRSSRGTDHTLTLPAGVELGEVTVNDRSQPLQLRDGTLTVPLIPGTQRLRVSWREPHGMDTFYQTAAVGLGTDSVNDHIILTVPHDRWTLFVGGLALGPAVLFWGLLLVILLAALALSRYAGTPLGSWQWFLLGVGLSQANPLCAAAVISWLILLGRRARLPGDVSNRTFNLIQVMLALLSVVALVALGSAIHQGLLGQPDMQITGNDSSAYELRWYQDRSPERLPQAWTVSVPLPVYRLLMLSWALWLAFALLRWLSWAWSCFSSGGLWRRLELHKAP